MEKLELKHLAPYFPYGLKAFFKQKNDKKCRKMVVGTIGAIYSDELSIVCYDTVNSTPDKFFILLHPLTEYKILNLDILDEIEIEDLIKGSLHYSSLRFSLINRLFEEHFDVFGLIEKKLAIPKNSVIS